MTTNEPDPMVGRRVRTPMGVEGTAERWEPYGAALTDTLVRDDAGGVCWFASENLRPIDGRGPLPSRAEARAARDVEIRDFLRHSIEQTKAAIRTGPRWSGGEFGKALVGRAEAGALADVEARIAAREGRR